MPASCIRDRGARSRNGIPARRRRRPCDSRPRFRSSSGSPSSRAAGCLPTPEGTTMPLRSDVTIEHLRNRGDGRLPGLVGFRVVDLQEGLLQAELDIRPELLAPNGYLHAATVIALADTASGFGCIAHLPEGAQNFTTV